MNQTLTQRRHGYIQQQTTEREGWTGAAAYPRAGLCSLWRGRRDTCLGHLQSVTGGTAPRPTAEQSAQGETGRNREMLSHPNGWLDSHGKGSHGVCIEHDIVVCLFSPSLLPPFNPNTKRH